jgi:hypothetical protein
MSEVYSTHVDVDGDGHWDAHTVQSTYGGGVDVLADMNHDGRPDFIGHDTNADGLIDSSEYDHDFDGRFETHMTDTNRNGWQDHEVADRNDDHRVDLVGDDRNEDGFFDRVVADNNFDGHPDTVLADRNLDGRFDLVVHDDNGRWDVPFDSYDNDQDDTAYYGGPAADALVTK